MRFKWLTLAHVTGVERSHPKPNCDGSVVGDLTTARIMIEDGAYFKGSIEIDKAGDTSSDSTDFDKSYSSRGASKTTSAV
ncbi:MAG: hypothetical protein ACRD3Y_01245 [Bryobacteraceae bacterium]